MKVLYCHNRIVDYLDHRINYVNDGIINPRGGSTVAMEAIQSWLLDNLNQGDTIVRKIGIARCSKDDNYCKAKGRDLAFSRLKQKTLTVVNLVRIGTLTTVFFEDEDDNLFEIKKSRDPNCAILVRMLED